MKILKGISTCLFFSILFGACFDPPTFPDKPEIEFVSIKFVEGKTLLDNDSLNLVLKFKDGDGDLGLSDDYRSDPYHDFYFFLDNDAELDRVGTIRRYTDLGDFVNPSSGQQGKLATVRTRNKTGAQYDTLKPYVRPFSCFNYIYDSVLISAEDKFMFDNTYNIVDSLKNPSYPTVYVLLDTFLIEPNPYRYNIYVDFYIKNGNSEYKYEWNRCPQDNAPTGDFNSRFPVLSDKTGPLEGNLQYAMVSSGILEALSINTIRLEFYIYDRKFNKSNTESTPWFTLR